VTWVDGAPRAQWEDTGEVPRQVIGFWFAWHDFHPDTRLWGRLLASVVLPREEGGITRVVFSEPVDPDAVAAHVPRSVTARWLNERVLELSGSEPFTLPAGPYGRNGTSLAAPLAVPLGAIEGARQTPAPGVVGAVAVGVTITALAWLFRRRDSRS
jgi:hypothetical protein